MKWTKELPYDMYGIIAVDFDGTIVSDKYPNIGEPNHELISWLKESQNRGTKLILWTCRSNNMIIENKGALENAVEFCKSVGLEFDAVNENLPEVQSKWNNDTRKVLADIYIDDKNMLI